MFFDQATRIGARISQPPGLRKIEQLGQLGDASVGLVRRGLQLSMDASYVGVNDAPNLLPAEGGPNNVSPSLPVVPSCRVGSERQLLFFVSAP
jgi:hypothetical protein